MHLALVSEVEQKQRDTSKTLTVTRLRGTLEYKSIHHHLLGLCQRRVLGHMVGLRCSMLVFKWTHSHVRSQRTFKLAITSWLELSSSRAAFRDACFASSANSASSSRLLVSRPTLQILGTSVTPICSHIFSEIRSGEQFSCLDTSLA